MSQIASLTAETVPTSFGTFKPVGYLMVGLPSPDAVQALQASLASAGWTQADMLHFAPGDSAAELEDMIANASGIAGFGYEITLLRRYLDLTRQGVRWLLVAADDTVQATEVADLARQHGATLAVYYRNLTIEELI
jgi:hypothetical protein